MRRADHAVMSPVTGMLNGKHSEQKSEIIFEVQLSLQILLEPLLLFACDYTLSNS